MNVQLTANKIADWKKYESSIYNYSIKYPVTYSEKDWASVIEETVEITQTNRNLLSFIYFGANSSEFDNEFSIIIFNKTWDAKVELLGYSVPNLVKAGFTITGVAGIKATGSDFIEGESIEKDFGLV